MTKTLTTVLAAVLATAIAVPAFAGGMAFRHENQRARIRHGIRDGSLSRGETVRLTRQQVRIGRAEARLRADGRLTRRERTRLRGRQRLASRHIYRARHNGRTRSR